MGLTRKPATKDKLIIEETNELGERLAHAISDEELRNFTQSEVKSVRRESANGIYSYFRKQSNPNIISWLTEIYNHNLRLGIPPNMFVVVRNLQSRAHKD